MNVSWMNLEWEEKRFKLETLTRNSGWRTQVPSPFLPIPCPSYPQVSLSVVNSDRALQSYHWQQCNSQVGVWSSLAAIIPRIRKFVHINPRRKWPFSAVSLLHPTRTPKRYVNRPKEKKFCHHGTDKPDKSQQRWAATTWLAWFYNGKSFTLQGIQKVADKFSQSWM